MSARARHRAHGFFFFFFFAPFSIHFWRRKEREGSLGWSENGSRKTFNRALFGGDEAFDSFELLARRWERWKRQMSGWKKWRQGNNWIITWKFRIQTWKQMLAANSFSLLVKHALLFFNSSLSHTSSYWRRSVFFNKVFSIKKIVRNQAKMLRILLFSIWNCNLLTMGTSISLFQW